MNEYPSSMLLRDEMIFRSNGSTYYHNLTREGEGKNQHQYSNLEVVVVVLMIILSVRMFNSKASP